jgi:hypothetical protein
VDHRSKFEALFSLAGQWVGERPTGSKLSVTYSLHAKASVLMEHWRINETTDALTLYHMDGDVLMTTHYCPLCNQPRLKLAFEDNGELGFEFVSATNLRDLSDEHQHSFQIRLIDDTSFWRSETYVGGSGGFQEAVTFRRINGV